jgi:hypothetical protein
MQAQVKATFKRVSFVFLLVLLNSGAAQAKDSGDQDQIILLNDSAAALEDSDPGLSRELTRLADEQERVWEDKNANKPQLPIPVTDGRIKQLQDEIKLLKAAARAIQPNYPVIAQGLRKMAKDINRSMENEN